jgi:hypothetical protein
MYLDFFPIVNRSWKDLCGIRCLMILVAHEVPAKLEAYKQDIILFPPIPGVSDILISQMVRLLYTCIYTDTTNGIIVSDMDLIPMNKFYYIDSAAHVPQDHFLVYREACFEENQIAICFNSATPAVWKEVWSNFGVPIDSVQDIREYLQTVAQATEYDGRPGQPGWTTDQLMLYKMIFKYKDDTKRVTILNDAMTKHMRLDRIYTHQLVANKELVLQQVNAGYYSDYHMQRPWNHYKFIILYFVKDILSRESLKMIVEYKS